MPVTPPDGPGTDTKGSSNTKCTCIINTHDRGPSNRSQKIDLSPYLTNVSVHQHLSGGGSATINLPAIDFIEDIIAAGDLINIYFNTNRSDSDVYNIGNVRTFFGFVDTVTRTVSVTGVGEKLTAYTIVCKDFGKVVRETQIYNNEHLANQVRGSKTDVVREDLSTNLGGIGLITQGIVWAGNPRQIIIQNLLRFLGFGGQYALPHSYREALPNSSSSIKRKSSFLSQIKYPSLEEVKNRVLNQDDIKVKQEFITTLTELAKAATEQKTSVSNLWNGVNMPNTNTAASFGGGEPTGSRSALGIILESEIINLKNAYRETLVQYDFKPLTQDAKLSHINNTFFEIRGINKKDFPLGMGALVPSVIVTMEEQGLKDDIQLSINNVIDTILGINPEVLDAFAFPTANLYAQTWGKNSDRYATKVQTFANILCFDYLEDVKGYWADWSITKYSGSLLSALQTGANMNQNELIFDLRVSPLFTPLEKDGLGVPLEGALPMVPAVVLRRKPYTNYPTASNVIQNSDIGGSLITGGIKGSDQLIINSGSSLGVSGMIRLGASQQGKVQKQIDLLSSVLSTAGITSSDVSENVPLTEIHSPTPGRGDIVKDIFDSPTTPSFQDRVSKLSSGTEVGINADIIAMFDVAVSATNVAGSSKAATDLILKHKNVDLSLAEKELAHVVTMPRPIFRSPDNNRITKELEFSTTQRMMGVANPGSNDFFVFGTKDSKQALSNPYWKGNTSIYNPPSATFRLANPLEDLSPALSLGSSMGDIYGAMNESDNSDWHVLDYLALSPKDVISESFTRGDMEVYNFFEYFGATLGKLDAQRLFLGATMPITTPISVYRFGVRLKSISTQHVQALLTGGVGAEDQQNVLLRWVVLQDLWNQHNHELLSGTMSLRGMPGIRPGYRIDRPDTNLSFYVEQVSHSWSYPGNLTTQVTVSRGQPMGEKNALPYRRFSAQIPAAESERQDLGKVFKTSEFRKGDTTYKSEIPGTYTGSHSIGRQLKIKERDKDPK